MEPTRENLRAFDQLHRTRVDALDAGGRLPEAAREWRDQRVLHLGCRTGETTAELVGVGALVRREARVAALRGDLALFHAEVGADDEDHLHVLLRYRGATK